jgi:hypothetical protein
LRGSWKIRGNKIVSRPLTKKFHDKGSWSRPDYVIMTFVDFLDSEQHFSNIFSFEMQRRYVEPTNAEIGLSRVHCASSRASRIVMEFGFVLIATIASGEDVVFGDLTLTLFAFHANADGTDLI